MSAKTQAQTGGIGLGGAMFLVFMTLKLTGHIAWSWLWVTAPLWIPLAIFLSFIAIAGLAVGVLFAFDKIRGRS